jgi:putative ABC transport system substrate-binding protein
MRRRDFLALAGAAAAFPRVTFAQQAAKVPRVALVSSAVPTTATVIGGDANWSAFLDQMKSHGFVEGRTVVYERYLVPQDRANELVPPIIASAPDLIDFGGASAAALVAIPLSKTIPMVVYGGDLLAFGMVTNLAHPGGNVTGLMTVASLDAPAKLLALLSETVPSAKRFAYVVSGSGGKPLPVLQPAFDVATTAAAKLGVSLLPIFIETGVTTEANFAKAFEAIAANNVEAVLLGSDSTVQIGLPLLAKLAIAAKMPAICQFSAFPDAGGLLSYGPDFIYQSRQKGDYIALILNGTKPGDLPVLEPTVFLFEINLKTATAIGVTIPPSILAQATQVIE